LVPGICDATAITYLYEFDSLSTRVAQCTEQGHEIAWLPAQIAKKSPGLAGALLKQLLQY
jgi:hypothetical protein